MSEHQTFPTGSGRSSTDDAERQQASARAEQFVRSVQALRVPNEAQQLERRLYLAGIVLPVIGLVIIWIGWWGASGTKYVYQEIPYILSGGIFGASLVLIGAALFARYSVARLLRFWLARLVADQQIQIDRVVQAIDALGEILQARAAFSGRADDGDSLGTPAGGE